MKKQKYKARKGSRFKGKDAQIIGDALQDLKNGYGCITTEQVVNHAKLKKSPIHSYFEWDNTEAAEKYRFQQAREMMSNIVEVTIIDGEKSEQRSWLSVSKEVDGKNKKVYVTLKDAVAIPSYRKQLLNKAIITLENLTITMKMFREQDTQ